MIIYLAADGRQRLTLPYSYNEVNMFALHFVCMLRINTALDKFSNEWKYHPLFSARNRLPYQLWHYGMAPLMDLDPIFWKLARVRCWSQWNQFQKSILQIALKYLNHDSFVQHLCTRINSYYFPTFKWWWWTNRGI